MPPSVKGVHSLPVVAVEGFEAVTIDQHGPDVGARSYPVAVLLVGHGILVCQEARDGWVPVVHHGHGPVRMDAFDPVEPTFVGVRLIPRRQQGGLEAWFLGHATAEYQKQVGFSRHGLRRPCS